jgi:hypothetical protein
MPVEDDLVSFAAEQFLARACRWKQKDGKRSLRYIAAAEGEPAHTLEIAIVQADVEMF